LYREIIEKDLPSKPSFEELNSIGTFTRLDDNIVCIAQGVRMSSVLYVLPDTPEGSQKRKRGDDNDDNSDINHGVDVSSDGDDDTSTTSSDDSGSTCSNNTKDADENTDPISITVKAPKSKKFVMTINTTTFVEHVLYELRKRSLLDCDSVYNLACKDGGILDHEQPMMKQISGKESILKAVVRDGSRTKRRRTDGNCSSKPVIISKPGRVFHVSLTLSLSAVFREQQFVYVSESETHHAAIDIYGRVFTYGDNIHGALGPLGYNEHSVSGIQDAIMVCCGSHFTVALTRDNKIYAWGSFVDQNDTITSIGDQPTLMDVKLKRGETPVKITAGAAHFLVLTSEGRVFSCGYHQCFQLGRDTSKKNGFDLHPLNLQDIKDIACGYFNSFAIDEDGDAYAWGLNNHLQTGIENKPNARGANKLYVKTPTMISLTESVKQVSAAKNHAIVLFDNGEIETLGIINDIETDEDSLPHGIVHIVAGTVFDLIQTDTGKAYYRMYESNRWEQMAGDSNPKQIGSGGIALM